MSVFVEIHRPANERYFSFIEKGKCEVGQSSRFWGVQVVIFDQEGRVFMRRDPDGNKLEGNIEGVEEFGLVGNREIGGYGVFISNSRPRKFNSVSGGAAFKEDPIEAAKREMKEELDGRFLGNGEFVFHDDLPVFACYQEGENRAQLLGGLLVTYHASSEEIGLLSKEGRFWAMETVYRRVTPRSTNELFRPAFRVAIWILYNRDRAGSIEKLVEAVNSAMIDTAIYRSQENGISLSLGIFEEQARLQALAWENYVEVE
jgi:hypothetical protein